MASKKSSAPPASWKGEAVTISLIGGRKVQGKLAEIRKEHYVVETDKGEVIVGMQGVVTMEKTSAVVEAQRAEVQALAKLVGRGGGFLGR